MNSRMIENEGTQFYAYQKQKGLIPYTVRKFRTLVYRFYRKNARSTLPWRNTTDPYHILVSEVMLQQTQIERVLSKYPEFITKYPDLRSLARSRVRALYAVWQGLGYNRRALALKEIAKTVIRPPYHGRIPGDVQELMKLPFVGQSTAGAVAAFAFNQPSVFIETNIRRVFIHFFFQTEKRITDRDILPLIERTLDRKDPRSWYYALMDYGTALRDLNENPNRKSSHYKKQSSFTGSTRQMRGRILNIISGRRQISMNELAEQLDRPSDRILSIIDQLCHDGFLKKKGQDIRMA